MARQKCLKIGDKIIKLFIDSIFRSNTMLFKLLCRALFKKPRAYTYESYQVSNNTQRNKQKGDKYELQIGKDYQKQGYKVYFKGINEGLCDKGIDLIAYKGKEALLIQCKNWEHSQVKQEHLRIFLGDCTAYIEQNQKIFVKKNVRRVFVTSCENMDYGVKKFIMENNIEYKIIPYEV